MIRRFSKGFLAYFRAFRVLAKRPSLFRHVLIPVLINVLIYTGLVYLSISRFSEIMGWFLSQPETWYGYVLYYALAAILVLSIVMAMVLTFTVVGNLIASPFCDMLSESVATVECGRATEKRAESFCTFVKRMLLTEFKKMFLLIGLGMGSLFLNMIPFLGLVSSLLMTLLIAFEYLDYNFSREGWLIRDRITFILRHFPEAFGFGLSVGLGMVVPILNFFVLPLAVMGGTLLFCEEVPHRSLSEK
ncbi:MAG: EI24 domain-containing protein [Deltaproteobacteria bacterium]|nr:EI24 domain-containing protein [Deltaproteobacteria bacterium]